MSDMDTDDYNRAFHAITLLINDGMSAEKACDKVTHQFRHLIGNDDAASECLYEEASDYEDARREAACEEADMAELGYGEG